MIPITSKKTIFFRVDSSLDIGTGHIMRCLTLADALHKRGAKITFLIRSQSGALKDIILDKGHSVQELPAIKNKIGDGDGLRQPYSSWLRVSQEEDARDTIKVLENNRPDWLIIDHYALDEKWHRALRPHVEKIMVIDDLADRNYDCDLLLDQNYFHNMEARYEGKIPAQTKTLLGPQFALLRPEFQEMREKHTKRSDQLKHLFVFFGGSDPLNMTGMALKALSDPSLAFLEIDAVIGSQNPHRKQIEELVQKRPRTKLHIQISNIAELMAKANFAIGAGGATTWERLCLGLPSIVISMAENQIEFSSDLHDVGLIKYLGDFAQVNKSDILNAVFRIIKSDRNFNDNKSLQSLVDGLGADRVANKLIEYYI